MKRYLVLIFFITLSINSLNSMHHIECAERYFTSKTGDKIINIDKDGDFRLKILKGTLRIIFSKPVNRGRIQIFDNKGRMLFNQLLGDGIDVLNMDGSIFGKGEYQIKYLHKEGSDVIYFKKQ